jgi:hypothetical protein
MRPAHLNDDDDDQDDSIDREAPDPSDMDADDADDANHDDDVDTIPCPYCRKPVYEQADICPHCGSFISREDAPRRRPWWVWLGAVLAFLAVLYWLR